MAAPAIPSIRLGLIGTGLAVGKLHWPALCGLADRNGRFADGSGSGPALAAWTANSLTLDLAPTGGAIGNYTAFYPEIPVPPEPNDTRPYGTGSERSNSDTKVFRGIANGYRAKLVDLAHAVHFGVRLVLSVANAMVVQRALGSAERAAVLTSDPVPGGWTGLPGQRISSSASFAA